MLSLGKSFLFHITVKYICSMTGTEIKKQNISSAIGTLPLVIFLILFLKDSEGGISLCSPVDLKHAGRGVCHCFVTGSLYLVLAGCVDQGGFELTDSLTSTYQVLGIKRPAPCPALLVGFQLTAYLMLG